MSAAATASLWTGSIFVGLAVFGLLIGSFLNVVAYRVPAGMSVVTPGSSCPGCGAAIRPRDNIPVVSWLLLRGRCRDCAEPISWRYPLVETATAVLFAVAALRFLPGVLVAPDARHAIAGALEFVAFLYFAAISVALSVIDLDTQRLPNVIVLPSLIVGSVLLGASSLVSGDLGSLASAGTGMAGLFILYLIIALVSPRGMGFGDVKLAGVLGLYVGFLGVGPLLIGAFAAFVLGGLFGIGVMLARRGRRHGIPFGPWMFAGAWVGILAGPMLWQSYLALVAPA